ncbi:Cof-type HAD-IIB family hydrolase [Pseudolactococcus reticulitermitis]|uniref:Uncharacterized protein n=1 Tax=Pseudolactococcus reticulitermitis TaxID=2025039 RepID=A0A224X199_9LACT|nr:Cof-type HAD-IIB family hydrolase [Lactococcus reticulitermitis]GAX47967.1 hypothetical protein RsY01_1581 [Lactococcus reticulitermitis]
MTIKLIATDMDGTFLDGNGAYDKARFDKILTALEEKNILFAAASGRQLLALEAMFADFSDRILFVAENGGIVKYQDHILFEEKMPFDKVLEIADIVRKSDYIQDDSVLLSGANGSYILETASDYYKKKANFYYKNVQALPDFSGVVDDILKLTVNFTAARVLEGEAWVNQQVTGVRAVTTGFESIDIIPTGISKATGLSHIAEKFAISPAGMLAFGDNLNDLEMLTYAGTAIATSNARDEIKAVADRVIGNHKDQAVLTYLEELLKSKNA